MCSKLDSKWTVLPILWTNGRKKLKKGGLGDRNKLRFSGLGLDKQGGFFQSMGQKLSVEVRSGEGFKFSGWLVAERKRETGPLVLSAFSPNAAAMPLDDTVDNGEADARAFEFLRLMEALEDLEKLVCVSLIEPDAIILDVVEGKGGFAAPANFNECFGGEPGKFKSIGN